MKEKIFGVALLILVGHIFFMDIVLCSDYGFECSGVNPDVRAELNLPYVLVASTEKFCPGDLPKCDNTNATRTSKFEVDNFLHHNGIKYDKYILTLYITRILVDVNICNSLGIKFKHRSTCVSYLALESFLNCMNDDLCAVEERNNYYDCFNGFSSFFSKNFWYKRKEEEKDWKKERKKLLATWVKRTKNSDGRWRLKNFGRAGMTYPGGYSNYNIGGKKFIRKKKKNHAKKK